MEREDAPCDGEHLKRRDAMMRRKKQAEERMLKKSKKVISNRQMDEVKAIGK